MNNIGRCPRCGKFLVAEQYEAHTCDFRDVPIQDCKEIVLDHMTDCGMNKDGDNVTLGWGIDGTLYRLVVCKHKEPHPRIHQYRSPRDNAIECLEGGFPPKYLESIWCQV